MTTERIPFRKTFTRQWRLVSLLNTALVGVVSSSIGLSLLSAEQKFDEGLVWLVMLVCPVIGGLGVGLLEWLILRSILPYATSWTQLSTIGAFTLGAFLSALGLFFAANGVLFPPLCLGWLLLWAASLALPLLIPRTWPQNPFKSVEQEGGPS